MIHPQTLLHTSKSEVTKEQENNRYYASKLADYYGEDDNTALYAHEDSRKPKNPKKRK